MAKLLFHGLPAYGHLFPLLPLAAAARSAGHQVVFVTGAEFAPLLRSYGFPVVPAGLSAQEVAAEIFGGPVPRRPDGRANKKAQIILFGEELPRRTSAELRTAFAGVAPDLVVHEHTSIGAALAAAMLGLPTVSFGIVAGAATDLYDPTRSPRFGDLLVEHGLSSLAELRPRRLLDPFPAALRSGPDGPWPRTPIRPVAWSAAPEPASPDPAPSEQVPRWLVESRRPVVYLTLGTVFGTAATLHRMALGLSRLGVDVLLAPGSVSIADLGPLPDRVRVEGFVDQGRVLPLVDAVVHHGGSGTTLGAAAVGLPQLVVPSGADQHANGEALAAAGAGRLLEPDEVQPERVAAEVSRLLDDPALAAAAQRIRRQIATMPSPEAVVATLDIAVPAAV